MGKILSICIPSYNMEKYLDRSVGSLLVPEVLDKLEIIIVNDGSKDSTLAIANKYKEQYPQSVVVIDKPNGHYGSTVNAALKIATGKYFRILDADDWFDRDGLVQFVARLEELDVDCVYTHFTIWEENTSSVREVRGLRYNEVIDLTCKHVEIPRASLGMRSLTFRLGLLKDIAYVQTEGICYTDTEYVYYPLVNAKNIYFTDINLYQYFFGREEQSMSAISMSKCGAHFGQILERMLGTQIKTPNKIYDAVNLALSKRLLCFYLYSSLVIVKANRSEYTAIWNLVNEVEKINPNVVNETLQRTLYKIHIFKLWYNKNPFAPILLSIIHKLITRKRPN